MSADIIKLRDDYNKIHGKPGKVFKGVLPVKKEEIMAAQIKLHTETRKKLGIDKFQNPVVPPPDVKTPPGRVPPRPETKKGMRNYYDTNKTLILQDLAVMGEKKMRDRWGISQAIWLTRRKTGAWSGLAVRFGVVQPPAVKASQPAAPEKPKRVYRRKAKPRELPACESPGPDCLACHFKLEALAYAGYRRAVQDMRMISRESESGIESGDYGWNFEVVDGFRRQQVG